MGAAVLFLRHFPYLIFHFTLPEDYRAAAKDRRVRQGHNGAHSNNQKVEVLKILAVLCGPWRLAG
jgi:hypothetical protein